MAVLLNLTPFADNTIVDNGPSYAYRLICRDAIREQLWMLEQTAKKDNGGRYVFCHILLPHHNEYMFDENERLPLPAISVGGSLEGYTNHLSYITRRLTEVIKLIPEDAIIILQADTGYIVQPGRDAPDFLTKASAYTLNAIRLPNSNYVPESLVNTYRLLLNEPLLPDRFCFTRVVSGVGRAYETPTGEYIEVG
ncbi:unnamed protein product [marine sediment metagenome]|uniref:Uncharacterized protein n=1 Tax=marine sediment metagenome TaxID=412755 RepID=X1BKW6_9ZZZZ